MLRTSIIGLLEIWTAFLSEVVAHSLFRSNLLSCNLKTGPRFRHDTGNFLSLLGFLELSVFEL